MFIGQQFVLALIKMKGGDATITVQDGMSAMAFAAHPVRRISIMIIVLLTLVLSVAAKAH